MVFCMHRSMGGCSSAASNFEEPEEEFKMPPGQQWRYSSCTVRAHHQLSILIKKQDCDYCRIVDKIRRLGIAVMYVIWIFVLTEKALCSLWSFAHVYLTVESLLFEKVAHNHLTVLHFIELLIMSLMPSRGKRRGRLAMDLFSFLHLFFCQKKEWRKLNKSECIQRRGKSPLQNLLPHQNVQNHS